MGRRRKGPVVYNPELYKSRNLIERLFGRLKDRQGHLDCRLGYLLVMSPELKKLFLSGGAVWENSASLNRLLKTRSVGRI